VTSDWADKLMVEQHFARSYGSPRELRVESEDCVHAVLLADQLKDLLITRLIAQ
jgi:hypothetical protein